MSTTIDPVRWGIMGTARINAKLVAGARAIETADIAAVASRSLERARTHAAELGVPRALGSYEALLEDPAIEAVYISLPNRLHHEWTLRALAAGKHVLCEKPYSRRAADVEEAWAAAAEAGVVLQEAFMWRHSPQTRRLLELLPRIGPVQVIRATFAFTLREDANIRLAADLDGGSLMDVGCYTVSGARLLAGADPVRVHGEQLVGPSGVDVRFTGLLRFPGDVTAVTMSALTTDHQGLEAIGERGSIFLADPWHCRTPSIRVRTGEDEEVIELPFTNPYGEELRDMGEAIRTGRPPLLGRADALGQARTIEALYRSAASGDSVSLG